MNVILFPGKAKWNFKDCETKGYSPSALPLAARFSPPVALKFTSGTADVILITLSQSTCITAQMTLALKG
jgi:hypothetical protein